jgi:4'-phosphopantetheinyl transferase
MVKVYATNIKDIVIDPEWLRFVSDNMRQRLGKIRHFQTYAQTLIGDLLIRYLAIQYARVDNQDLLFATTESGKPYLANANQPFHFNLSHSGHWVVCAVDKGPVGIDVQLMEPIDPDLAKSVLSPQAFQQYQHISPDERIDYFYGFWTLHESYLKLTGQGLSDSAIMLKDQFEKRIYRRYYLEPEYRLAACSYENQFESDLYFINVMELILRLSMSQ